MHIYVAKTQKEGWQNDGLDWVKEDTKNFPEDKPTFKMCSYYVKHRDDGSPLLRKNVCTPTYDENIAIVHYTYDKSLTLTPRIGIQQGGNHPGSPEPSTPMMPITVECRTTQSPSASTGSLTFNQLQSTPRKNYRTRSHSRSPYTTKKNYRARSRSQSQSNGKKKSSTLSYRQSRSTTKVNERARSHSQVQSRGKKQNRVRFHSQWQPTGKNYRARSLSQSRSKGKTNNRAPSRGRPRSTGRKNNGARSNSKSRSTGKSYRAASRRQSRSRSKMNIRSRSRRKSQSRMRKNGRSRSRSKVRSTKRKKNSTQSLNESPSEYFDEIPFTVEKNEPSCSQQNDIAQSPSDSAPAPVTAQTYDDFKPIKRRVVKIRPRNRLAKRMPVYTLEDSVQAGTVPCLPDTSLLPCSMFF